MKKNIIEHVYEKLSKNQKVDLTFSVEGEKIHRRFVPHERLILLGGGHISQALCEFASKLDFDVWVVDDRPDFANNYLFPNAKKIICMEFDDAIKELEITEYDYIAVLTRGHKWDRECLRQILKGTQPYYLGQVGSKRRIFGLFHVLEKEDGIDPERLREIHGPIGLPIGGQTPNEIAISILAQLIQKRNKADIDEKILKQTNMPKDIFRDILENKEPLAIAVVIGTSGSVPTKTGSIMICSILGRTSGTVGGGCGEFEVIKCARDVIRQNTPKLVEVDMNNDVSSDEGMVCGGSMQVWIEPIN